MNFYQAPIARFIHTSAADAGTIARPVTVGNDGLYATDTTPATIAHGRNVTVFFETPGWPTASHKIDVRGMVGTATTGQLRAAPNVCLSDADSYLFLRGNQVFDNNGTEANGIHVVYAATLDARLTGSARATDPNNYWVRPGDTFTFNTPSGALADTTNSNLGSDGTRVRVGTITAVRQKGGPDRLSIEFSVPIVTTDVATYRTAVTSRSTWPLRDLVFFSGGAIGSATNPVGLAFNRQAVQVTSSAGGWSGTLSAAVNLTYPSANPVSAFVPAPASTGLTAAGGSAGLIDPSTITVTTASVLANTGRQMNFRLDNTALTRSTCSYTFEHRPDFNQGSVPYRCISFSASANWAIELLVHPLH